MSETQENKIIPFPVENVVRVLPNGIQTMDDMELYVKRISAFRKLIVNDYLSQIIPSLFNQFALAGFDMVSIATSMEAALVVESIKSYVDKQLNIEHPFQHLSKELFKIDPKTDIIIYNEDNGIIKPEGVKEVTKDEILDE